MVNYSNQPFPIKKEAKIEKVTSPIQKFMKDEASSGIILIITIVTALVWANINPSSYFAVWENKFTITLGDLTLSKEISLWINDLLMSIFFLLVGLEIKRELLVGELVDTKRAMLPISAAIGGIVLPALIYLSFNYNNNLTARGWAIPAATDIAFALGILYLLGDRVPVAARIFLATLAIIDDIAVILIIAVFYTEEVIFIYLILAGIMFLILAFMNLLNVRPIFPYLIVGSVLWYGFFASGIHATIAGVIIALTIPASTKINHLEFKEKTKAIIAGLVKVTNGNNVDTDDLPKYLDHIASLEHACREIEAPLQRLEHSLAPWVTFVIMPIFALANAGVVLSKELLSHILDPVSLGIIFGLVVGKPIGIFITTYIAVKLRIASIHPKLSWMQILGIGFIAGIGFTISTFISVLAFETDPNTLSIAKVAILIGSFIAGGIGFILLQKSNNISKSSRS